MAGGAKPSKAGPTKPEKTMHTLENLEQVRVLADPLRMRIIESLCEEERTTKQIADLIGEKPTKLYHHVEALEKVGLIRMTRTRQNRGTLEKYYVAIARAFQTDPAMFGVDSGSAEGNETIRSVVSTIFANTLSELESLVEAAGEAGAGKLTDQGVISYIEIRATKEEAVKLQRRIKRLLKDLQARCAEPDDAEEKYKSFRLTLAYYPLELDLDLSED